MDTQDIQDYLDRQPELTAFFASREKLAIWLQPPLNRFLVVVHQSLTAPERDILMQAESVEAFRDTVLETYFQILYQQSPIAVPLAEIIDFCVLLAGKTINFNRELLYISPETSWRKSEITIQQWLIDIHILEVLLDKKYTRLAHAYIYAFLDYRFALKHLHQVERYDFFKPFPRDNPIFKLGVGADRRPIPEILKAAESDHAVIRYSALVSLARFDNAEILALVLRACASTDPGSVYFGTFALRRMAERNAEAAAALETLQQQALLPARYLGIKETRSLLYRREMLSFLVVEDSKDLREDFADTIKLEFERAIVLQTDNGLEVLELARLYCPDLILLDTYLPGLHGAEALALLKKENPAVRVIMLPAGHIEDDVFYFHMGAFDVITKPFKLEGLLYSIDDAFYPLPDDRDYTHFVPLLHTQLLKATHADDIRYILAVLRDIPGEASRQIIDAWHAEHPDNTQ